MDDETLANSAALISSALNDTPAEVEPTTSPGHPAWQGILDQIPEMLRPNVIPQLQEWDKGVEAKLASVHDQYAPYKSFLDQQITADQLETANRLYQALDSDPEGFFNQLKDHYKFGAADAGPELDLGEYSADNVDLSQNPLFKQQAEQLSQMQAAFESQQAEQSQKEADIWLQSRQAQIAAQLEEKKIEVDWDYILPRAAAEAQRTNDYDKALDNATAAFEAMVVKYRTPVANLTAPPVFTPNGSVPSSSVNINSLAPEDRRKFMAQMLAQALKD